MSARLPRRRLLLGAGALAGAAAAGAVADGLLGPAPAAPPDLVGAPRRVAVRAAEFDAAVPALWATGFLRLVKANGAPPPSAAKLFCHLGLVLHAAAAAGTADARPLAGAVPGALGRWVPPELPGDLHWPSVASAAFEHLLTRHHVDLAGPVLADVLAAGRRGAGAVGPALRDRSAEAGVALGRAVVDWDLAAVQSDLRQTEPVPRAAPRGPGSWRATPPEYELPVLPTWGHVPTMVLARGSDVGPGDPDPYSEAPGSPCRVAHEEVLGVVAGLTPEQLAIARHWADGEWSITPPGHWLALATDTVTAAIPFDTAAEVLLRLAAAQHDAFVSCWYAKYRYDVLRPVTYVREVLGERTWLPPVKTPPFPEYPSGHSVQSAAAAEVLTAALGAVPVVDRVIEREKQLPVRTYPDWAAAAREAAVSRVYGGIHVRAAVERGLEQGRRIGAAVAAVPLRG